MTGSIIPQRKETWNVIVHMGREKRSLVKVEGCEILYYIVAGYGLLPDPTKGEIALPYKGEMRHGITKPSL
jgi:hypothetical protein